MIYISYAQPTDKLLWQQDSVFIKQKIKDILKYYKLKKSIFIVLTDSENMAQFNKEYRNIHKDTNVIAMEMTNDPICLGEIILSFGKITNEFKIKELPYDIYHSFQTYLLFILTHGFLHLLGYDHQTDSEEGIMNREQTKLLQYLNL